MNLIAQKRILCGVASETGSLCFAFWEEIDPFTENLKILLR